MVTASIVKPGVYLPADLVDRSAYGGWTEIFGLYSDLCDIGYKVTLNSVQPATEVLFVFPSANNGKEALFAIKQYSGLKYQCLTDLQLRYTAGEIGPHSVLNQVKGSPGYFPFECYLLRDASFQCVERRFNYRDWQLRSVRCVYAGRSRNGERDRLMLEYFSSGAFDSLIGSFQISADITVTPSVGFDVLQAHYLNCKFALLITDPLYCSLGMKTQRIYEYLLAGVVPIVDVRSAYMIDYDTRFPTVRNPNELIEVINSFDEIQYEIFAKAALQKIRDSNFTSEKIQRLLYKREGSPL